MKKALITTLSFLIFTLLFCGVAFAETATFNAQGRTVVPVFYTHFSKSDSFTYSFISISNITSEAVQCKVTILDHDGNDQTHRGYIASGQYGGNSVPKTYPGNGEFEIPAYGTRLFCIADTSQKYSIYGQAIIEWKSTDPRTSKALMGTMRYYGQSGSTDRTRSGSIAINNGLPF
ncbi:hypothetical protein [Maridesulfovibrio sp.]|uniref:hypothetical protein n=1 Tax=Maridesulfovibrio sp. TaxID=2795000 RepID=UPI003BAB8A76